MVGAVDTARMVPRMPPGHPRRYTRGMSTWTCDACGAYPADRWGACPSCSGLRPVERGWPSGATVIALYGGRTQAETAPSYAAHARALEAAGYHPVATSWGDDRPGAGTATLLANIEEAYRAGTLLVTYRRDGQG